MHGDFSLNPLNYRERVSRVLYQQGRVQLDSDFNEQTESTLRFLRGLAQDVIGFHGGAGRSFKIIGDPAPKKTFRVAWGEYYVDGIRCVNLPGDLWDIIGSKQKMADLGDGREITSHTDSYWDADAKFDEPQLIYLAAWEQHISAAERDEIREVALNGPDTASRAAVVWQIRAIAAEEVGKLARELIKDLGLSDPAKAGTDPNAWKVDPVYLALNLTLRSSARLKAFAKENQDLEPCTISPEARYRGGENRLYRVEIHQGGDDKTATYKWSPDNGAIVFPVREIEGKTVFLDSLGRDERTAIMKNDWVEVIDDSITLRRQVNKLVQVTDVDRHRMTVTLSAEPDNNAGSDPDLHPILRRWAGDAKPVKLNTDVDLDDGVKVQFSLDAPPSGRFRHGDYWLIPARSATGDVIWPGGKNTPEALRPHGIDEHYAPLALFNPMATADADRYKDFRWRFQPIADPVTHP